MPFFIDSGIFRDFGIEGVKVMLGDRKYHSFATSLTIRRAVWADLREEIRSFVPHSLVVAVRNRLAKRSAREFSLG
jgi:hypothetical protein